MEKITLAGCAVINNEGKLLLIHRNTPKRVQWEIPGGKIDEGEDPEQTAIRELQEEIGVKVEILKQLGKKDFIEDAYTMEYIWFLATILEGTPEAMEKDKYDDIGYFSWEQLQDMPDISPNTKNLVAAYFAQEINL